MKRGGLDTKLWLKCQLYHYGLYDPKPFARPLGASVSLAVTNTVGDDVHRKLGQDLLQRKTLL